MKNTLENIYKLLKNPNGEFITPEGERYIKVVRYSLNPFEYSEQSHLELDTELKEVNYVYGFCRGVDTNALVGVSNSTILRNVFYLKENTRVLSRVLDKDKFELMTIGGVSDLLKQAHEELEFNLEANFFNDNAVYDVVDLSYIRTEVLLPETLGEISPVIHMPADIERPTSVTPEEALFAHILIKRLMGMHLIKETTPMWMGHVQGSNIFILDIEGVLLIQTRQERNGLNMYFYESKGIQEDFESEIIFILGAVNALFLFGGMGHDIKQMRMAIGTAAVFNTSSESEVAATTMFSEQWAIDRLESIEGSYATNFKYLVDEHAATGSSFNIGEYLLTYLAKNKKVPSSVLAELSYYYYSTYDSNFDESTTIESIRAKLKEEYGY